MAEKSLPQKLGELQGAVRRAKADLADFIAATFPIGTRVSWISGRGTRVQGHVTLLSRGFDRFQVENEASGKRSWISSYNGVSLLPPPSPTPVQEVDLAGTCPRCDGPVYHRPGHPGEYDHACALQACANCGGRGKHIHGCELDVAPVQEVDRG